MRTGFSMQIASHFPTASTTTIQDHLQGYIYIIYSTLIYICIYESPLSIPYATLKGVLLKCYYKSTLCWG